MSSLSLPACEVRPLFGGAMHMMVPRGWLDTEAYMDVIRRPVPDNQEIFVAPPPGTEGGAVSADAPQPLALFVDVLEAATAACPGDGGADGGAGGAGMLLLPAFHAAELLRRDERGDEAAALDAAATATEGLAEELASERGALAAAAAAAGAADGEACAAGWAALRGARHVAVSPRLRHEAGPGLACVGATFPPLGLEVVVCRIPKHDTDLVFSLHGRVSAVAAASSSSPSPEKDEEEGLGGRSRPTACPPLADLVASLQVEDWGLFGGEGEEESGGGEVGTERYLGS